MKILVKVSEGWRRFLQKLRSTPRTLEGELAQKVRQQVNLLHRDVILYIDSKKHGIPNSPLTVLAKGSSKPLVQHGDLRQSISTLVERVPGGIAGYVGAMRTRGRYNIAQILHDGATIRVTPEVRAAVFAQIRKRRGRKAIDFEGSGKRRVRRWRIRGRPFIGEPLTAAVPRIKLALGDAVRVSLQKP